MKTTSFFEQRFEEIRPFLGLQACSKNVDILSRVG